MDAFEIADSEERFDFIFCFGILHRVENPLGTPPRPRPACSTRVGRYCSRRTGLSTTPTVKPERCDVPNPGRCLYRMTTRLLAVLVRSAIANLAALAGRPEL